MRRAVIITSTGFRDEEFTYPYYRLLEGDFTVDIATKSGETVYGKFGQPAKANKSVTEIKSTDYDLCLLPGGLEAPDHVRAWPEALKFIQEIDREGKVLAAICHAPWILISAGVVKGRKITAYWSMEADVRNSGAEYLHKAPVVIDGNIITSPHYDNNPQFMKAVLSKF
jgi:protease I